MLDLCINFGGKGGGGYVFPHSFINYDSSKTQITNCMVLD